MSKIDPADFNVITSAFKSIAQEMSDILLLSAYSSIVREAKDCSTCVMDAQARTVAQAEAIPMHMNSLAAAVPFIRAKYDLEKVRPTDAFVTNNPYENGQHLKRHNLHSTDFPRGSAGRLCRQHLPPSRGRRCRRWVECGRD